MSPGSRTKSSLAALAAALLVASVLIVAFVGPRLAKTLHAVKQREDVYVLPPPAELRALTLGYHAAATDLLWAKLLVEYGIHAAERRPFPDLEHYLDALLALEPDYAPLFSYVDTILVYRPGKGATADDARKARKYLEQGIASRPYDHEVWLHYGQFVAFLGPNYLATQEEKDRWRRDGADAVMRAVELGAEVDRALSAATVLSHAGERDAAIRHIRRAYALTDDPTERAELESKLMRLQGAAERDAAERDTKIIEESWRSSFPFVTRGLYLLVGPLRNAPRCAGLASGPECAAHWEARLHAQ